MDNARFDLWVEQPLPVMSTAQLDKFSDFDSIHVQEIGTYSPPKLASKLGLLANSKVIGLDLGGGSVRGGVYEVQPDGNLQLTDDSSETTMAENGDGFLALLEKYAEYAGQNKLRVGLSYGGPLDGTKPLYHPKIPTLMDELRAKYDGDFKNVFTTPVSVINDGPAGLIRAVDMVYRSGVENPVVLYLINGGGLGLAVYKDEKIFSTESGHVECVPELNINNVTRPCGIYGDFVCLENVISNKQGLERQWQEKFGTFLNGKEIEDRFRHGDEFAARLFEQTALIQAVLLQGAANVFNVQIGQSNFAVVVHGGIQRTPNIRKRTAQILWQDPDTQKEIPFTEEFDHNACMHGAALEALNNQ